jgi:hypothetical protein
VYSQLFDTPVIHDVLGDNSLSDKNSTNSAQSLWLGYGPKDAELAHAVGRPRWLLATILLWDSHNPLLQFMGFGWLVFFPESALVLIITINAYVRNWIISQVLSAEPQNK